MTKYLQIGLLLTITCISSSCVSTKKFQTVQLELEDMTNNLRSTQNDLLDCNNKYKDQDKVITKLKGDIDKKDSEQSLKDVAISDMKEQISDLKKQRQEQYTQVGDLTILSKSANENIGKTIEQLENKDKYIRHLQAAKNKADSLNLALAINLKSVLKKGIDDEDVEVKVDKTVVYVNLSDKMMYTSGSANITPRANEVLEKIAQICSPFCYRSVKSWAWADTLSRRQAQKSTLCEPGIGLIDRRKPAQNKMTIAGSIEACSAGRCPTQVSRARPYSASLADLHLELSRT